MTRTERLQPIVQHTDNKQQQALLELARSQEVVDQERAKLAQLKNYKVEYEKSRHLDNRVFSAMELQEFHRFLEQLDDTISKQKQIIKLRKNQLEQKRQCWNETRIKSKVMHKVVDNLQQQEFIEQEHKEQKALDEFSQRVKIQG